MKNKLPRAALLALALLCMPGAAQSSGTSECPFPEIPRLESRNPLFSQYQQAMVDANKARAANKKPLPEFFCYTAKEGDTLYTVSARCSLRYETLATLNGVAEISESILGRRLILPVMQGLYLTTEPRTVLEILIAKENSEGISEGKYPILSIGGRDFYFLDGARLTSTQRAFFLTPQMVLPLERSIVTSEFGMRVSPISGRWLKHHGIDMAAPLGSSIFACQNGSVQRVLRMDATYGNCVVILHANGMTSLYAHMDGVYVEENQMVVAGQKIGTVGLTGLTTGPHLHFEIRTQSGSSMDPRDMLDIP